MTYLGYIPVNGHPPYSKQIREAILAAMDVDRPVTATEIAAVVRYAPHYVSDVMRWMVIDGVILDVGHRRGHGAARLYDLDRTPTMKTCTACHGQNR